MFNWGKQKTALCFWFKSSSRELKTEAENRHNHFNLCFYQVVNTRGRKSKKRASWNLPQTETLSHNFMREFEISTIKL